jgi:hypothetical protein
MSNLLRIAEALRHAPVLPRRREGNLLEHDHVGIRLAERPGEQSEPGLERSLVQPVAEAVQDVVRDHGDRRAHRHGTADRADEALARRGQRGARGEQEGRCENHGVDDGHGTRQYAVRRPARHSGVDTLPFGSYHRAGS